MISRPPEERITFADDPQKRNRGNGVSATNGLTLLEMTVYTGVEMFTARKTTDRKRVKRLVWSVVYVRP